MEERFRNLDYQNWKPVRTLGGDSYGTVYEIARDDGFGMVDHAALKVLSIPAAPEDFDALVAEERTPEEVTALFHRQVETIARQLMAVDAISDEPNLLRCEDHVIRAHADGRGWDIYVRTELLPSLPDYLRNHPHGEADIIRLGAGLCSALETCHRRGIVHGDIKPRNVFVGGGNFNEQVTYKLGDFGMAQFSAVDNTNDFMAPEVLCGAPVSPASDLYSVGMVLYWALNERRIPFVPLPPTAVDVNVHPAKLEVKLSDERSVFDAVVNACRGALARMNRTVAVRDVGGKRFSDFELRNRPAEGTQTRMTVEQYRQMAESLPEKKSYSSMGTLMSGGGSDQYRRGLPPKGTSYGMGAQPPAEPRKWEPVKPKTSVEEIGVTDDEPHKKAENQAVTITDKSNEAVALSAIGGRPVVVDLPVEEAKAERHEPVTLPMYGGKPVVTEPLEPTAQREEPEQAQEPEPEPDYRLIGEVFATYIMAERDNEMLLIDKHAAHERILFNRLKRQHQSGAVERQVLLVPLTIHMPRELYDAAIKDLDCFERAGFAAEDFGEGCLRVREVPTILEDIPAEDLLTELCERLLHRGGMDEEAIYDELYHSVACKAAIKGNIPSMEREQQELLALCAQGNARLIQLEKNILGEIL